MVKNYSLIIDYIKINLQPVFRHPAAAAVFSVLNGGGDGSSTKAVAVAVSHKEDKGEQNLAETSLRRSPLIRSAAHCVDVKKPTAPIGHIGIYTHIIVHGVESLTKT